LRRKLLYPLPVLKKAKVSGTETLREFHEAVQEAGGYTSKKNVSLYLPTAVSPPTAPVFPGAREQVWRDQWNGAKEGVEPVS
jgi:hypothetical protein